MTDPESLEEYEFTDDESTFDLVEINEHQERVVEVICNYRRKLMEAEFSDEACEIMTIQYHQQLRS